MSIVTLSDAEARLADLVTRVQAGEVIQISNEGEVIAELSPVRVKKKPVDIAALERLTSGMRHQDVSAGEFVRAMRDEERY